jgi:hypothetical protein
MANWDFLCKQSAAAPNINLSERLSLAFACTETPVAKLMFAKIAAWAEAQSNLSCWHQVSDR